MPYIDLSGVHLWYNDTGGTGVPVVLMHAASGTCESWVYQLPVFTTAGYRCIAYDRRNWGRSRPNSTGAQPGSVSDDLHGPGSGTKWFNFNDPDGSLIHIEQV